MDYQQMYDVIVAGGGVSGCAAAVAAARAGASVLLLERNGYLGGALTAYGVGPMMTFHAGDKQVIRGFMQEVVDELVRRGYSPGHVPDTKQYTPTITPFDAEGLKLVLDDLTERSVCTVLFHTAIGGVEVADQQITGLTVCNKDGLHTLRSRIYIDATGDGDIAAWSGALMTKGRPSDGAAQPMTMKMKVCNVDTRRLKEYVLANLDRFPQMKEHGDLLRQDIPMDLEGFEQEFAAAKAAGELTIQRENVLLFATGREGEYIFNTTRITGHDATDAESLSNAERIGRRQCEELLRFARRQMPGFENCHLEFTGPSVGVRGSRQLVGVYTLTAEDVLSCRKFPSAIAHSGYPIDIHSPDGEGTESSFLEYGRYYGIPYEIMVCHAIDNLLVTGRCVSATFEAQAAIRLTPSSGAMGQAAGLAAALACQTGQLPRRIDTALLRDHLRQQGAYLDDYSN